jgi:hypothetical protein
MNTQTSNKTVIPVLAGIFKVPTTFLNIASCFLFNNLQNEAQKRNLKLLDTQKWHLTLIHQSFLKALSKLVKKKKAELILPSFPELLFFNGQDNGEHVRMVMDINPRTEEVRETLRLVLCDADQIALKEYVAEFCELNQVEIDDFEKSRIFHVSFANRTGLPGDSVR